MTLLFSVEEIFHSRELHGALLQCFTGIEFQGFRAKRAVGFDVTSEEKINAVLNSVGDVVEVK